MIFTLYLHILSSRHEPIGATAAAESSRHPPPAPPHHQIRRQVDPRRRRRPRHPPRQAADHHTARGQAPHQGDRLPLPARSAVCEAGRAVGRRVLARPARAQLLQRERRGGEQRPQVVE